jgi:hypothetical protein
MRSDFGLTDAGVARRRQQVAGILRWAPTSVTVAALDVEEAGDGQ